VWVTADDERVCPQCGGADGENVNMNDLFRIGKLLPPAHPSCRCAVAYVEVAENILTPAYSNSKIGDTDGYTRVDRIRDIDFDDGKAVQREVDAFLDKYKNADAEHSVVITKSGKVYELTGTSGTVNPEIIGADELKGSIGAHNHPLWEGYDKADSFSIDDLLFAARHKTGTEYLTSGKRRDAFLYTGDLTEEEIYRAYQTAQSSVYQRAFETGTQLLFRNADFMRELSKTLEGLIFHENI